jgi:hypothetical protein
VNSDDPVARLELRIKHPEYDVTIPLSVPLAALPADEDDLLDTLSDGVVVILKDRSGRLICSTENVRGGFPLIDNNRPVTAVDYVPSQDEGD